MVVVLPAPLGPSRPKHSPRRDLEVEAVDGEHVGRVALHQAAAADGEVGHAGRKITRGPGALGPTARTGPR